MLGSMLPSARLIREAVVGLAVSARITPEPNSQRCATVAP